MCCGSQTEEAGTFWTTDGGSSSSGAAAPAEPLLSSGDTPAEEEHGLFHAIAWMAIGVFLVSIARSQGWVR